MYESSQMIPTPRRYSLKELFHLCETEGKFDDKYTLVTEKTLTKHIRFPGLSKTVIEVYPDPKGQNALVVNLTKESRGKDFALSMLTDGWSDILSSGQEDNAYKVAVICEEFRRLIALSANNPMSLADGVIMEAEVSSGFSTLELIAYDDRLEFLNTKKGKTLVFPYNQIKEVEAKNKTLTVRKTDGSSEVGVFSSLEEFSAWDRFIQSKMQEARTQHVPTPAAQPAPVTASQPATSPAVPLVVAPEVPAAPPPVEQTAPSPSAPVAPAHAPVSAEPAGLPRETETYCGFKTLRTIAHDDRIELIHVKKNKTTEIMFSNIQDLESKKDTMTFDLRVGGVEVLVFQTNEDCDEWDRFIRSKMS